MRRVRLSGELLLSLGLVTFGIFLAIQTASIEVSPSYARVGPRVFPWVVSCAIVVLGLWLAREAVLGQWVAEDSTPGGPDFDWPAFLFIGAGLLAHMLLISWRWGGFVIASAALFVCVARGFGSRSWLRDTIIGLILSAVVYVGFQYGLGLDLPAGALRGIL